MDNRNLIGLRKKLHELKIHKELMCVLRRKYGFETKEKINKTVRQEMDFLDIPSYIQQKVQASLEEQGKDDSENLNAYHLLLEKGEVGQESCEDYIRSLQDLPELELCKKIGVDIEKLEMHFQNLVPKILYILNVFQTGQSEILPENLNPSTILNNTGLEGDLKHPSNLDLATILRILVMLHNKFSSSFG